MKSNELKMKSQDYFEAIIQLRPRDQKLIDYVNNQIKKRENNVFVAKVIDWKKIGIDIYISDQKYAVAIGRKLKRAFKGDLKISKKLFTQSRVTSKFVYRVTVCFREKIEEDL